MWAFGYGSLMWDSWETKLGCLRRAVAELDGYRRTFNKASVKNWGTQKAPCPTLNLEKHASGTCRGMAFEFSDDRAKEVREYLAGREGRDFALQELMIRLEDGVEARAFVPVYRGKNLVQAMTTREKAAMIRNAHGSSGPCAAYIKGIAEKLSQLGINDPAVTELWQEVKGCS